MGQALQGLEACRSGTISEMDIPEKGQAIDKTEKYRSDLIR